MKKVLLAVPKLLLYLVGYVGYLYVHFKWFKEIFSWVAVLLAIMGGMMVYTLFQHKYVALCVGIGMIIYFLIMMVMEAISSQK